MSVMLPQDQQYYGRFPVVAIMLNVTIPTIIYDGQNIKEIFLLPLLRTWVRGEGPL